MPSIQHHFEWAVAERLVATEAHDASDAELHEALADMHEQSAAYGVNTSLAPFDPASARGRSRRGHVPSCSSLEVRQC
jgi:hypothetical protein